MARSGCQEHRYLRRMSRVDSRGKGSAVMGHEGSPEEATMRPPVHGGPPKDESMSKTPEPYLDIGYLQM